MVQRGYGKRPDRSAGESCLLPLLDTCSPNLPQEYEGVETRRVQVNLTVNKTGRAGPYEPTNTVKLHKP